jgi:hypothetical protein
MVVFFIPVEWQGKPTFPSHFHYPLWDGCEFLKDLLDIAKGNIGSAELRLFPKPKEIFRLILQRSKTDKSYIRLRLYVTKSSESTFRKVIMKGRFSADVLKDQGETIQEIVDATKPEA